MYFHFALYLLSSIFSQRDAFGISSIFILHTGGDWSMSMKARKLQILLVTFIHPSQIRSQEYTRSQHQPVISQFINLYLRVGPPLSPGNSGACLPAIGYWLLALSSDCVSLTHQPTSLPAHQLTTFPSHQLSNSLTLQWTNSLSVPKGNGHGFSETRNPFRFLILVCSAAQLMSSSYDKPCSAGGMSALVQPFPYSENMIVYILIMIKN
jgi:hypothetical protein